MGLLIGMAGWLMAQSPPEFRGIRRLTNQEVELTLSAPPGFNYRIDATTNLPQWQGLLTLQSTGMNLHADTAGPYLDTRFYRAEQLTASNVVTGDHLVTEESEVVIHPINHASLVLQWASTNLIYCDPVGAASLYQGLPRADLILLTHNHGDHFNTGTIDIVRGTNRPVILAPQAVYNGLTSAQRTLARVMTNGMSIDVTGMTIAAIPSYNLTSQSHLKGIGNGYVLTIGGRQIYISGDTEDTPEMRALRNIDLAFLCMNQPYTMTVSQAVSAAREFVPRVVYPYHYRNGDGTYSDVAGFKQQVGTDLGIEVRLRKWY